jgi:hypothetical protein
VWTDLLPKIGRTKREKTSFNTFYLYSLLFFQTKLILRLLKVKQIPVGLRGYVETRQPNGNLLLLKPRKTEDAV